MLCCELCCVMLLYYVMLWVALWVALCCVVGWVVAVPAHRITRKSFFLWILCIYVVSEWVREWVSECKWMSVRVSGYVGVSGWVCMWVDEWVSHGVEIVFRWIAKWVWLLDWSNECAWVSVRVSVGLHASSFAGKQNAKLSNHYIKPRISLHAITYSLECTHSLARSPNALPLPSLVPVSGSNRWFVLEKRIRKLDQFQSRDIDWQVTEHGKIT